MATDTSTRDTRSARTAAGVKRRRNKGEDIGLRTLAFDSVGPRKYALQVRKASNGNPYLKIVEGIPQEGSGEFRKYHIAVWSEDFERWWKMLDEAREFIRANDIRTPKGHKYVPGKKKKKKTTTKSK